MFPFIRDNKFFNFVLDAKTIVSEIKKICAIFIYFHIYIYIYIYIYSITVLCISYLLSTVLRGIQFLINHFL